MLGVKYGFQPAPCEKLLLIWRRTLPPDSVLTYMSIDELILGHVGSRQLTRWMPMFPKNKRGRRLYLSPEVVWLLETDHSEADAIVRCEELSQELQRFADSGLVGVCMTPYEANEEASLGLLAPSNDGIWDYRSVDPSPGLRIVGAFASRDTFIGLQWAPRSVPFLDREPLRDRNSREWNDVIRATKAHWRRLFATWEPLKGGRLDEFISENCHPV